MALGTVWRSPGGHTRGGMAAPGTAPGPVTPVSIVDPQTTWEYRNLHLRAEMGDPNDLISTSRPVAMVPAPPRGQILMIERLTITNPAAYTDPDGGTIFLCLGRVAVSEAVDATFANPAPAVTICDPWPIVLTDAGLLIVWANATDPAGCTALAQVRVETAP